MQQVADLLDINLESIPDKRKNHELLGIDDNGEIMYQSRQFNENEVVNGLDQILLLFSQEEIGVGQC